MIALSSIKYFIAILAIGLTMILSGLAHAETPSTDTITSTPKPTVSKPFDPRKLIIRPKSAMQNPPTFTEDPVGWLQIKQRQFYSGMSSALRKFHHNGQWASAWILIALSFVYGVLHAAGPGHGKAVVSAWLLANEQQLRRGIIIAVMAAFIQAMTAVVLVSGLLLIVGTAGSLARSMTRYLEAASFALIGVVGLYLIWQAWQQLVARQFIARQLVTRQLVAQQPVAKSHQTATVAAAGSGHHHHHDHDHHGDDCDCGHSHMPDIDNLNGDWSWGKAFSLAFAVGIRPCGGAILVLLSSAPIGLYWVGIISTFAMAIGTAITVSTIAIITVTSRDLALRIAGRDRVWFNRITIALRFCAGVFITLVGGILFYVTITNKLIF